MKRPRPRPASTRADARAIALTTATVVVTFGLSLALLAPRAAEADPCGMVPPIYTGRGDPIERVGEQKTFVFFDRGVESFVIRPGFRGKVENFGMLIPFPSPPELRKVPDEIFNHIAAAIDPPEVVEYVNRWPRKMRRSAMASGAAPKRAKGGGLKVDEVRVLRQEAVGMYEVAVLEAGSAGALKRWMDDHKFKYPDGMDAPCNDYVAAGWCFVAVKTRVGKKSDVDPRPGMRKARAALPSGGSFSGHVQGMGFRFRSKRLVVPMRLSAFNKGRLRNIVYLLSRGPKRIKSIPDKYVMRQLPGWKLYRNLTRLLPLRVIGGSYKDLRPHQKQGLAQRRNPKPHNGLAAELFAGDLLAARTKHLSHAFERREKALLNISERLGLRGKQIDALHAEVVKKSRDEHLGRGLARVKRMTMTVVDGDFPRDVIAGDNLTFTAFSMPAGRNNSRTYNARTAGPGTERRDGRLYRGALDVPDGQRRATRAGFGGAASAAERGSAKLQRRPPTERREGGAAEAALPPQRGGLWQGPPEQSPRSSAGLGAVDRITLLVLALVALGLWIIGRRRRRRGDTTLAGLLALALGLASAGRDAHADQARELIAQLGDAQRAGSAVKKLVALGSAAKSRLIDHAFDGDDIVSRGWAIVALAQIGGDDVDQEMSKLLANRNHPALVRNWALAARIELAKDSQALLELARHAGSYPAVNRPLGKRLAALLSRGGASAETLLEGVVRMPQLRGALSEPILSLGASKLVAAMRAAKDQSVRRYAAGYLATLAQRGKQTQVAEAVVDAYRFAPRSQRVPWDGGPLFVPSINWPRDASRALVDQLVRWFLWCERRGDIATQKQLHNNLRSLGLARTAGYTSPGWQAVGVESWLRSWGGVVGRRGIEAILREQGVLSQKRYRLILEQLR